MNITRDIIDDVVQKIVKNIHPEKVILFGSCARGNQVAESDLDILVIKESALRRDKRAKEIYRLLADRMFPLDIIVYTPEEVERYAKLSGSFVKDVVEHGEVVYDRAA